MKKDFIYTYREKNSPSKTTAKKMRLEGSFKACFFCYKPSLNFIFCAIAS